MKRKITMKRKTSEKIQIFEKPIVFNSLRAFDTVSTPNGKGRLFAHDGNGNFFVAINRKDLVNATCVGPCLHLWYKLDELKGN